ncbi:MAG: hypothetical protein ABIH00_11190 [Armatimonadota bacterium]
MEIISTASTRIDLAGGTLDIYPLYVFENRAVTVNIAIDLKSQVKINLRDDDRITIFSEDNDKKVEVENVNDLKNGHDLDLIVRTVKFYNPGIGMDITTKSVVPNGSGLGASSSILMALSSALNMIVQKTTDNNDIINWGANLEAQTIAVPTGKQDYYAAIYGGINVIWFDVSGIRLEPVTLSKDNLKLLKESLILSYTGISHFSGNHNWDMMKLYIDKNKKTHESMKRIKDISFKMRDALICFDIEKIAYVLNLEWQNRKNLAKGITNRRIDMLMQKAHKAGAMASKICGAGGGGCMISVADPYKRAEVIDALEENGAKVMDFNIDFEGLKINKLPFVNAV